ncbi:MAG: acetoin dehydrogenase dihydrolipoyllysine-residue acetyltransferase subunit [Rhizobiales bacterium]|nr:acetoin dehydrogenase dihydrolipoyllysine-residue acetyltransferase subunit [Hyphomicrobiales bacterium]
MAIQPITMPKWGLAMEEGMLARWAVPEGADIAAGQEIMDIETTKIANVFESPVAGVLRRKVVDDGETVAVGALLGVVAEPGVPDAEIDAYVGEFLESFKHAEKAASGVPVPEVIDVGGQRIRHLKAGTDKPGTPILMIHGFGADMTTWMFNQGALAEERPVYAIDLPGHGGSTKTVGDASAAGLATTVLGYMEAAGIARAHLVGHSLGGAIAVEIARRAPDRVAALTLISPAGLGTEISEKFIEGFIGESRARKLRPVLEMLVANPQMVTADMVEEVLKFKRLDGALDALRAVADANFSGGAQKHSVREALAAIKVPVGIVWGEGDRILPAAHGEGLPETVVVTRIAGAGHIPHMEKAAEVNEAIRALAA